MGDQVCPKCRAEVAPGASECPVCGVVLVKWKPQPKWLGPYIYKMVQAAQHIVAPQEKLKGNEAAEYLEALVNDQARQGWEFFRVDEMAVSVSSPALFGTRSQDLTGRLYIVTFRRPSSETP
jgi:ribosomal protein L40E